jgi:4-hydroxyphenylpyruvate dioxygenase-like putative hemolysin
MNLQEDINRIKQVMGINENKDFMFFKRREDELAEYLDNIQQQVLPEFFDTFSEYYNTVINATMVHYFESPNTLPGQTEENIRMLRAILVRLLNNNEELMNIMKDDFERSKS